jgi:hypothetical protein
MIEYLDRLEIDMDGEVWLVRVDGVLGQARIYHEEDPSWFEQVATESTRWIGFAHPHVVPLLSITLAERLVVVTGDERGPTIMEVARRLDDPRDREAWALTELAGIAEGIAMMTWRDKTFVHRRADPSHMVVGSDGHARLRAPIAQITAGPRPHYLGRGRLVIGVSWMSPEQVLGLKLTTASDVFQLAVIAYAALALKRPFSAETDFETLLAIREAAPPPPPPTSTPGLAELILRGLAREPSLRPRNPGAFAAALRGLVPEPSPVVFAKVQQLRPDRAPASHVPSTIAGIRCKKRWTDLAPTAADGVRHCASCKHDVVEVRSLEAVIPLLGRQCISYKPE